MLLTHHIFLANDTQFIIVSVLQKDNYCVLKFCCYLIIKINVKNKPGLSHLNTLVTLEHIAT